MTKSARSAPLFLRERAVDDVVDEVRERFAGASELVIQSNRGTRQNAMEIFDRTFYDHDRRCKLLATVVAFIGILSTLMSLQLERMRENRRVLRSTGMTRRQLWRLSLFETSLIGASAGLIAIPTGLIAGDNSYLHHQPTLVRLDAGDAIATTSICASICRGFVRGAGGRDLSGLAYGPHPTCRGIACRIAACAPGGKRRQAINICSS